MNSLQLSQLTDVDPTNPTYNKRFLENATLDALSNFTSYLTSKSFDGHTFWKALASKAKRGLKKNIEHSLVHHLWQIMLIAENIDRKLQACLCYISLLGVPGEYSKRRCEQM